MSDYLKELTQYLGKDIFDYLLINSRKPPDDLIEAYAEEGEIVKNDIHDSRVIEAELLGLLEKPRSKDLMKRSLIRHDSKKLAEELMKIVTHL